MWSVVGDVWRAWRAVGNVWRAAWRCSWVVGRALEGLVYRYPPTEER